MTLRTIGFSPVLAFRPGGLSVGMIFRVAFTALALCLALGPALSAERLALKGDIAAKGDALTLADLIQGASGPLSEKPLFRSPGLGQTGTIQARRIVEAASESGLGPVETGGRTQVVVTRVARRIAGPEIEAAVKAAFETQKLLDPDNISIVFDGAPALVVPPDLQGPAGSDELSYDRRTRRLSAIVSVGTAAGEKRASLRVTGTVIETVELTILTRSLGRGETVQPSDLSIERRPKESAPSEIQTDGHQIAGRVARRPLSAGTVLRLGDLARPELIGRGEAILVVYEVPGLSLTVRGKAVEAGALGDTIAVVNPQSKRTVQATVTGPGKASAITTATSGAKPATVADASAARQ